LFYTPSSSYGRQADGMVMPRVPADTQVWGWICELGEASGRGAALVAGAGFGSASQGGDLTGRGGCGDEAEETGGIEGEGQVEVLELCGWGRAAGAAFGDEADVFAVGEGFALGCGHGAVMGAGAAAAGG
jgi:hypothetical protein